MDKSTVVYDVRPLLGPFVGRMAGVKTGVGEYAAQLLAALRQEERWRLVLFSNSLRAPSSSLQSFNIEIVHTRYPNRLLDLAARGFHRPFFDDLVAQRTDKPVDVWLSPHVTSAPVRRAKKIVVVHDCSFLYPRFFSLRKRYWHWSMGIRKTLNDSARVVAVSAHTATELTRHYHIPPEKTVTVYPGVDRRFFSAPSADEQNAVRAKYRLPPRFILFLGTVEPRKNILTLLQAFAKVAEHSDADLVLAGEIGWLARPILRALRAHPYARRIHRLGFVADADKNALYRLSSCFVYPSLYEGFGFPPLEALACGTPVVVSHATSLPEVVGENAITVDPYNADDLARAIQLSLDDANYRTRCAETGPLWARQFNWQATAEKISDIIESVAQSHPEPSFSDLDPEMNSG
ncbi:hypothetical protein A3J43_00465 [Candidatus Uhrbacteria bacterium RIFCSPHIGHO2_12_FULL_54_23]|uniref:Glycosyl transferase family 1 domain-containing protein n=2 Tax=Parcubacteria group TaxID=1794811 RepID=A0A1F7UIE0_9BACT|nr:MAG: Glycosyl transferase group 1 [Candidatus Magasanikbacteria bacterium GW2011_GWA2_50_22]OGL77498.1 MAG: hypothetical protein A3J43_00465 [Candidatus Uhrbacteria bacterium RIFCSPHIGHO2_12_FULL_54_23]